MVGWQTHADRHADLSDARDLANVFSLIGVARKLQSRADGQLLVFVGQLHDPLAHAAAGTVHADDSFHEYNSIALMISSKSFGTCTARLAYVARLTPRLPRTSSKVF